MKRLLGRLSSDAGLCSVALLLLVCWISRSSLPWTLIRSKTYSGIRFDNRSADPALSSIKEFPETSSSDINELSIAGRFKARSALYPNLFQTAGGETGLRAELYVPAVVNLYAKSLGSAGPVALRLTDSFTLGEWHSFAIRVGRDRRIEAEFDGRRTLDKVVPGLDLKVSGIAVGAGWDKQRVFDGEIQDFSLSYSMWSRPRRADLLLKLLASILGLAFLALAGLRTASAMAADAREAETPHPSAPNGPAFWAGMGGVLLPLAAYNLFFFNRYFPLTEGWFSAYASLILEGKSPYRDFYLFLPPLYPLQLAAFMAVFGPGFLTIRLMGIGLILMMGAMVYAMFARWFPVFAAALAALAAMMYYQSGVAHITYDFTQFLTAYALLSASLIVLHCEGGPEAAAGRRGSLYMLGAGAAAACAFLTKQSNGAFIAVFCGLAAAVGAFRFGAKQSLRTVLLFAAGALLPVAVLAAWLASRRALGPCIQQIYSDAVQAKGSLDSIFFSWTKGLFTSAYLSELWTLLLWALPLLGLNLLGARLRPVSPGFLFRQKRNVGLAAWIAFAALVCVSLPFYRPDAAKLLLGPGRSLYGLAVVAGTAAYGVLVLLFLGGLCLRRRVVPAGMACLGVIGIGLVIGNGTSAGIGEISCFVGVGLCVAAALSLRGDLFIGKAAAAAAALSFCAFFAAKKYDSPYAWWFVSQPDVRKDLRSGDIKLLSGFRLSEETWRTLKGPLEVIGRRAGPGDAVLAFPHMPVFYLLSGRWPQSPALVDWFDFLPDAKALEEAGRILAQPPAVIVRLDLPEEAWATHERLFRHGKPMGQRAILASLDKLTASGGAYGLSQSYELPDGCKMTVWTRGGGTEDSRPKAAAPSRS